MNTNQLLLVSSLGLGVNLFGMFAMGGHHHHVSYLSCQITEHSINTSAGGRRAFALPWTFTLLVFAY